MAKMKFEILAVKVNIVKRNKPFYVLFENILGK